MDNLRLLSLMKDSHGAAGAQLDAGEPYGVLTWLLAMVCGFVAAGTLVSKTTLGPADVSASSGSAAKHLAKLVRPKTKLASSPRRASRVESLESGSVPARN